MPTLLDVDLKLIRSHIVSYPRTNSFFRLITLAITLLEKATQPASMRLYIFRRVKHDNLAYQCLVTQIPIVVRNVKCPLQTARNDGSVRWQYLAFPLEVPQGRKLMRG